MKAKKINIKELTTPINYAEKRGIAKQTVYKWIRLGKIKSINIDGVPFLKKNEVNHMGIEVDINWI